MTEQTNPDQPQPKKRGRPRKSDELQPPRFTQERRDYLLAVEPPPWSEAKETGLPHLCITCEHCKVIRDCYEGWNRDETVVLTETRYLCGQQFNALQERAVMTCELYQVLPTES